jgi:transposase
MEVKPMLDLPEGLKIMSIEMRDHVLNITAISTQMHPCCPVCGTPAQRIHSSYHRQISDLPCSGQQVRFLVQVHKYFCDVLDCARKIFVERLTPFVEPWARVTQRLYQIVQMIGLATGGRLGVRVTDRLGIETSRQTILRRIMALPPTLAGPVTQIGIDDFSFRRRRKFATIVVDLQTHEVLDVLASSDCRYFSQMSGSPPRARNREQGPRRRLCSRSSESGSSSHSDCRPFPYLQKPDGSS